MGGCWTLGLVLPNVVRAVELTPNRTMKTVNSIVRLPHCVKRFKACMVATIVVPSMWGDVPLRDLCNNHYESQPRSSLDYAFSP